MSQGVPQGSIPDPALFNIYTDDLPSVPNVGSLKCHVDDSQLFMSFPFRNASVSKVQLTEDLREIAAWCCRDSLLINPDMTKLLLLATPQMLSRMSEDCSVTPWKDFNTIKVSKEPGNHLGCYFSI